MGKLTLAALATLLISCQIANADTSLEQQLVKQQRLSAMLRALHESGKVRFNGPQAETNFQAMLKQWEDTVTVLGGADNRYCDGVQNYRLQLVDYIRSVAPNQYFLQIAATISRFVGERDNAFVRQLMRHNDLPWADTSKMTQGYFRYPPSCAPNNLKGTLGLDILRRTDLPWRLVPEILGAIPRHVNAEELAAAQRVLNDTHIPWSAVALNFQALFGTR
jgi:hypothetical protein